MAANTCNQPPSFHNGTGAQADYVIGFPYINRADVEVYVGSADDWTQYTEGSAANANEYQWQNATTIRLNAAAGSDNVRITRETDRCAADTTFTAGASIRAEDLNENMTQNLYLTQEIIAALGDIGVSVPPGSSGEVDTSTWNDPSYLKWTGEGFTANGVLEAGDVWQDSDNWIATAAAGDDRWLSIPGQPGGTTISGGDGINVSNAGVISVDRANPSGLEVPGGQLKVDEGTGITVNASGVNVTSRTLWGQNHDHSANVSGDMSGVGNVTFDTNPTISAGDTDIQINENVVIDDHALIFEDSGTETCSIQIPGSLNSSYTITLPDRGPTVDNSLLVADNTGAMQWVSGSLYWSVDDTAGNEHLSPTNNRSVHLTGGGDLRFYDDDDSNFAGIRVPADVTGDYWITLPDEGPGSNNRMLEFDSNGNAAWVNTPTGGGGSSGGFAIIGGQGISQTDSDNDGDGTNDTRTLAVDLHNTSLSFDPAAGNAGKLLVTSRTLWGQAHDHTANVSGNMSDVGDITFNGNVVINTPANNNIQIDDSGTGILDIDRPVDIDNTVDITGATTVDGDFTVDATGGSEDITLTGPTVVDGDLTVTANGAGEDITLTGATNITGNVGVDGNVTLANAHTVDLTGTDDTPTEHTVSLQAPAGDAAFAADWTLTLPPTDGAPNQVLSTDGAGVTSWVNQTNNTNTTYDLSCEQTGGNNTDPTIRLTDSNGAFDNVQITGGNNITVTRNSATQLTIASGGGSVNTDNVVAQVKSMPNMYVNRVPITRGGTTFNAPTEAQFRNGRGLLSGSFGNMGGVDEIAWIDQNDKVWHHGAYRAATDSYAQATGASSSAYNGDWRIIPFQLSPQTIAGLEGNADYADWLRGTANGLDGDTSGTTYYDDDHRYTRIKYVVRSRSNFYAIDYVGNLHAAGVNNLGQNGNGSTTQSYAPVLVPFHQTDYTFTFVDTAHGGYIAATTFNNVVCERRRADNTVIDAAGGLLFDIITDAAGNVVVATANAVTSPNNGNQVIADGETVWILGTALNGGNPAPDLQITVAWNDVQNPPRQQVGTEKPKCIQAINQYGDNKATSTNDSLTAVTDDGDVYTCGYNGHGQLGRGNTSSTGQRYLNRLPRALFRTDPNEPGTERQIAFVYSTQYTLFAVSRDGFLFAWGYNAHRLIGNGTNTNQTTPYCINSHGNYSVDSFLPASDAGWVTNISGVTHDATNSTDGQGMLFDITFTAGVPTITITDFGNNMYRTGDEVTFNAATIGGGANLVITLDDYNQLNGRIVVHGIGDHGSGAWALDSEGQVYAWGYNTSWGGILGLSASTGGTTDPTAAAFTNNQYIAWPRRIHTDGAGQANGQTAVHRNGDYRLTTANQRVVAMYQAGHTTSATTYLITDGGERTGDATPANNFARFDYPRIFGFGHNSQGRAGRNYINYRVNVGAAAVVSNWLPDQECEYYRFNDLGQPNEWTALDGSTANHANVVPIQVANPGGLGANTQISQYTEAWFTLVGANERQRAFAHHPNNNSAGVILTTNGYFYTCGQWSSTQNHPWNNLGNNANNTCFSSDYGDANFYAFTPIRSQPAKFKDIYFNGPGLSTGAIYAIDTDGQPWYINSTTAMEAADITTNNGSTFLSFEPSQARSIAYAREYWTYYQRYATWHKGRLI